MHHPLLQRTYPQSLWPGIGGHSARHGLSEGLGRRRVTPQGDAPIRDILVHFYAVHSAQGFTVFYPCPKCKQVFVKFGMLGTHMRQVHKAAVPNRELDVIKKDRVSWANGKCPAMKGLNLSMWYYTWKFSRDTSELVRREQRWSVDIWRPPAARTEGPRSELRFREALRIPSQEMHGLCSQAVKVPPLSQSPGLSGGAAATLAAPASSGCVSGVEPCPGSRMDQPA